MPYESPVPPPASLAKKAPGTACSRKDARMLLIMLAVIIGTPVLYAMSGAGVLVESTTVDQLSGMGVARRS
jgi:hypothetical protein